MRKRALDVALRQLLLDVAVILRRGLRKTKAFRVAITDEVEVELPPESVIMDH